jgi:multiple sugar transport system substrate-binding protein
MNRVIIKPSDTKNLKRADLVFFAIGILVAAAAAALVFLTQDGNILPPKRTTIVFAQWWESGMEKGSLAGIIADFEKDHPLIRVRLHNADWENIRDGLLDRETERESPDIIAVDTGRLTEVVALGLLDILPDTLPSTVRGGETAASADTDGTRYYLRLVSFLHPLFYNIDLLSAAGFFRPPRTREEFLDYAKKTTEPEKGVYGTAFSRNAWTDIFPWIWAGGGAGVPIENSNWTSRPVINTLSFLSALNKENLVYPFPLSKREDELLDAFLAGNIAMFTASQAAAAEIRAKNPALSFGVTTIPQAAQPDRRNIFPITEWALAIPAKSAHKEEALSLLRYLAEREHDLAAAAHGLTDRYGYSAIGTDEDPINQKLRALYEASDTAAVSVLGTDAETILNETRVNLLSLFNGEKSETEAAAAIQAAFVYEQAAANPR